jgi:hypothetical protein
MKAVNALGGEPRGVPEPALGDAARVATATERAD